MARSYTIVAIPSKNDYVWRISSEKVPHLTLLFLGERLENVDRVAGFIEHAATNVLRTFSLTVDRRDVLGDQEADVLFFDTFKATLLKDFRSSLLTDPDIRNAYNSVEQFPKWIPHLTLGYPETPAKSDKREYAEFHWINFNRIALWTGDYEGVEFPLKNDTENELSMTASKGQAFLQHYGTKGMRWGVRRAERAEQRRSSMSDDARTADGVVAKAKTSGIHTTSNRELQDAINRMNLEQQYDRLRPRSSAERAKRFIAQQLLGIGKEQAQKYARDQIGEAIRKTKQGT